MKTMPIEEVQPHPHDIKCGRGHGSNMHPGNRYYQERVMENRQAYKESKGNFDKSLIAVSILDDIQNRSPPGRFLESHVRNGKEIWSIIVDRDTAIKKIKQALRDKHVRKKGDSVSASLSSNSSTITKSSVSTSSPTIGTRSTSSHVAGRNYGDVSMNHTQGQEEESKQNDEYVNNDWSSVPSHLYASMPPLSSSPQGFPSRDFSSMHIPYGLYRSNSHSTGEVRRGGEDSDSDSISLSLRSSDVQLLRESLRSVEMRDSLRSIDMEIIDDAMFE